MMRVCVERLKNRLFMEIIDVDDTHECVLQLLSQQYQFTSN